MNLNRNALNRVANSLNQALNSSNRAQSSFEALSGKEWNGSDAAASAMREAGRDTVELNSSSLGQSVLDQMNTLDNLQREIGTLTSDGRTSHTTTISSLRNALNQATTNGVPDDVRRAINDALRSAEGGESAVSRASSSVDGVEYASQDIRYGAREVASDTTPGEWEYGSDVSSYADSTGRAIDQTVDNLGDMRYEASSAASSHKYVGSDTESALKTVNAYLAQIGAPRVETAPVEDSLPQFSTPVSSPTLANSSAQSSFTPSSSQISAFEQMMISQLQDQIASMGVPPIWLFPPIPQPPAYPRLPF